MGLTKESQENIITGLGKGLRIFLDTKTNVLTVKDDKGNIQTLEEALNISSGGNPKVYRALVSQSGTDDPTIVELENTTGLTFSFVRVQPGRYQTDVDPNNDIRNKTFVLVSKNNNASNVSVQYSLSLSYKGATGTSATLDASFFDESAFLPADDLLENTPIEILIYE